MLINRLKWLDLASSHTGLAKAYLAVVNTHCLSSFINVPIVVQHDWVSSIGMKKVVNIVIVTSIIVPVFMDLSFQFPITDFAHGPYNHCIGRFEVYFNPTHKDPFTPGKSDRFSYDFVIA